MRLMLMKTPCWRRSDRFAYAAGDVFRYYLVQHQLDHSDYAYSLHKTSLLCLASRCDFDVHQPILVIFDRYITEKKTSSTLFIHMGPNL